MSSGCSTSDVFRTWSIVLCSVTGRTARRRVSAGLLGLSPLPSVVHGPEATPAPRQIGATNGPSGPGLWITATPSVDGSHRSSTWVALSNQVDIPWRLVRIDPYTSERPIPLPAEVVRLWNRTRTHPARRRRRAAVHNSQVTAAFAQRAGARLAGHTGGRNGRTERRIAAPSALSPFYRLQAASDLLTSATVMPGAPAPAASPTPAPPTRE